MGVQALARSMLACLVLCVFDSAYSQFLVSKPMLVLKVELMLEEYSAAIIMESLNV